MATKPISMGDKIVYKGAAANVELVQVYTSIDHTLYISDEEEGLAQVDIAEGTPITLAMIGDTDPNERMEPERIIEEVPVEEQIVIPYQITADYINEVTGEKIAESMDLQLDPGTNEKAFNMKEAVIDGYVLKSIKIEGNSVHSFGAVKKTLKAGPVMLYYYTNKRGWSRVEIKGNIRVVYSYVPETDMAKDTETEVDAELDAEGIPVEAVMPEETAVTEEPPVEETGVDTEEMTITEPADAQAAEIMPEETLQLDTAAAPADENMEAQEAGAENIAEELPQEIPVEDVTADDEGITFEDVQAQLSSGN